MEVDIRWLQRFNNFEKAFARLSEAVEAENLTELERNGLVQRFEFTLELAWKTLKDFLEYKGFLFKPSPKDTFRLAQESGFIDCAGELIEGLNLRNILSHDYDGEIFHLSEIELRENIYPALKRLYAFFLEEKNKK